MNIKIRTNGDLKVYEFRTQEDREKGAGFEIRCDTCGKISLSSHDRYCPFCGRDTVANFTARPLADEKCCFVTFRIDARLVVKVPVEDGESTEDILNDAQGIYEATDLGELEDIVKGEPVMIQDSDGNFIWEK